MAVDAARAKSLFLAASDLADPAERAAYLDRECGGDADLRARVEALLRANDAAPLPAAPGATVDRRFPRALIRPQVRAAVCSFSWANDAGWLPGCGVISTRPLLTPGHSAPGRGSRRRRPASFALHFLPPAVIPLLSAPRPPLRTMVAIAAHTSENAPQAEARPWTTAPTVPSFSNPPTRSTASTRSCAPSSSRACRWRMSPSIGATATTPCVPSSAASAGRWTPGNGPPFRHPTAGTPA